MESTIFDAVVIGAGQGGVPLSRALAGHGWKTALVERRQVGGACTNDGCTPTKVMVGIARLAESARRAAAFGVGCDGARVDLGLVKRHRDAAVRANRQRLEASIQEVEGCEVIYGAARFAAQQPGGGEHAVEVALPEGGVRVLRSRRVFLDVGERPQVPEIEGLAKGLSGVPGGVPGGVPCMDSTGVLELAELPEHLVILGGGYIAVEFAQIFRRFGSAVTVVERGPQLLGREDEDIAACLAEILQEDGVEVRLGAGVRRVAGTAGRVEVFFCGEDGQERSVAGSHLLVATGRVPNTENLGLEHVGVRLDPKGYVPVDERLRTAVEGIWAMGDVTGGPPYTHIAYDDFRVLRSQLLEDGSRVTTGRQVPYCVFTDPELGRVGMSEKEARAAGLAIQVATAPMRVVARAQEMGETRGVMKAVVDRATGEVLGAAILGVHGGEVVTQLEMAMMGGLDFRAIREGIFIHPVLAEGLHVLFRRLGE